MIGENNFTTRTNLACAASMLVAFHLLILGGCGVDERETSGAAGSGPSGSSSGSRAVEVDGSSTVYRISRTAQEAFRAVKPEVNVIVGSRGTGGGFGRYIEGEVDVIDASREAKPEEEIKAREKGYDWTRFLVGYDGITVVLNPENTFVRSLSASRLRSMFSKGSAVKRWSDVDKTWPSRPIIFHTPDKDSGTHEFFVEAIVGKGGAQRDDAQTSPDDNILVRGVAGDKDAVGYFGYAYYYANRSKLKAVPVSAKDDGPAVSPEKSSILDKSYAPLSRPLYIYVKNSSLKSAETREFVTFYLENLKTICEKAGYVPPPDRELEENASALAAAIGASR